jgi:predicted esterase
MQEHHFAVRRTARYVTLGEASGPVRQVWFACHGYGQLAAGFAADLGALADPARLIVVPEALSRFYLGGATGRHGPDAKIGASWMTREDRLAEIDDQVAYLDALYERVFADVRREAVACVALGFSQGASVVSRWLARGRARLDRVVLWGGMLPPELLAGEAAGGESGGDEGAARLRGVPLTFVLGTRDQFAPEAAIEAHERQIQRLGLTYRIVRFTGGHRLDDATLRDLAGEG